MEIDFDAQGRPVYREKGADTWNPFNNVDFNAPLEAEESTKNWSTGKTNVDCSIQLDAGRYLLLVNMATASRNKHTSVTPTFTFTPEIDAVVSIINDSITNGDGSHCSLYSAVALAVVDLLVPTTIAVSYYNFNMVSYVKMVAFKQ